MLDRDLNSRPPGIRVSLVGGGSAARHGRQLLLRSEKYEVRSYVTRAALLADPQSRDYPCIILDLETEPRDGLDLLRKMRASGWCGKALVLDDPEPDEPTLREAAVHGDWVLPRSIGDRALLTAICALMAHSCAGTNATS